MKTLEEIKKERNPRLQCTKCGKWRRLYLLNGKQTMYGGDSEEGTVCVECSKTIEIWKIDLERLLWSYHENGRPDGKTGVIGNPKTIEDFVQKLLESTISQTKQELIDKVENKLYTENGFFREDDGVAPDVQGILQDIKLEKLSNK